MIYKQCLFVELFGEDDEGNKHQSLPCAGIAVYDDHGQEDSVWATFEGVICAECGGWIEANDCEVIKTLDKWWSLEGAIEQNFYSDDTRGFRPEDQIKMELD